jgi:ferredoxin--NADP+ reductase
MNEERNDFAQFYDRDTFEAIEALSQRPHWTGEIDWHGAVEARGQEVWEMLSNPHTQVYLAGLKQIRDELDAVFARVAGSSEKWDRRKAELIAGERWHELLY